MPLYFAILYQQIGDLRLHLQMESKYSVCHDEVKELPTAALDPKISEIAMRGQDE